MLLTTHYMDEAERLCDRVAIVDRGKLHALGTPRELIAGLGGEHIIEFTVDVAANGGLEETQLAALPTVSSVRTEDRHLVLSVGEVHVVLPALLKLLEERRLQLTELTTRHATLDDVFIALAGRHLVDEEPEESGRAVATDSPRAAARTRS